MTNNKKIRIKNLKLKYKIINCGAQSECNELQRSFRVAKIMDLVFFLAEVYFDVDSENITLSELDVYLKSALREAFPGYADEDSLVLCTMDEYCHIKFCDHPHVASQRENPYTFENYIEFLRNFRKALGKKYLGIVGCEFGYYQRGCGMHMVQVTSEDITDAQMVSYDPCKAKGTHYVW